MEQKPKLTISGYRGIWNQDLDEKTVFEYIRAYAKFIKSKGGKKIIIGRDARKTGLTIFEVAKSALIKEGLIALNVGIIPTPSILLLVKKMSYAGAVIITASHNPENYNGFKFLMETGLFAGQKEIDEIEKIRKNLSKEEKTFVQDKETSQTEPDNKKYREMHLTEILKNIDVNLIRSKKFKVALDPINSAGSVITKELLKELGCDAYVINADQNGEFTHKPEPVQENLEQISEAVLENGSDVGFAQDPDADRLVVVNEKGEILSEEYTLVLAIKNILVRNNDSLPNNQNLKQKNDIVINMSSSRMSKDIASIYGGETFLAKVGELNVVEKMIEKNALVGGEGNGGVIYPKINMARDSLVGIALILELMARENKTISEIVATLPKYILKKEKITFTGDLDSLYKSLKKKLTGADVNAEDGVRFDWPDSSWIQIRPSNTEPIVRIIGEAKNKNRLEALFNEVKLTLNP